MKTRTGRSRREHQRGVTIFLFVIICLILLPAVFLMLQKSILQNRMSLRDRNLKTSREMAESVGMDFMNSFSMDWHRNPFDSLYTGHNNPDFANLGRATCAMTVEPASATIRIQTVATYDNGGALPQRERVTRGVDALYTWVADTTKFDYVWNNSVTLGISMDQGFDQANAGRINNTVFVRGNFDSGRSTFNYVVSGFWVVKGTFTLRSPATLENAVVHCYAFNNLAGPGSVTNSVVREIAPENFFPSIEIIPPEGGGVPGSLSYYDERSTVDIFVPNDGGVQLDISGPQYAITQLNSSFTPIGRTTAPCFSVPTSSTVPFTMVLIGSGAVILNNLWVERPTTLVAIGGPVHVRGNVRYIGGATAAANQSFSLLAEKSITFESETDQTLFGVYGTTIGNLQFTSERNVTVNGTLFGPIGTYSSPWGTRLTVTADPYLCIFPPPLYPRRPRIIMWDYVP